VKAVISTYLLKSVNSECTLYLQSTLQGVDNNRVSISSQTVTNFKQVKISFQTFIHNFDILEKQIKTNTIILYSFIHTL
jgi:hypothetical protein